MRNGDRMDCGRSFGDRLFALYESSLTPQKGPFERSDQRVELK